MPQHNNPQKPKIILFDHAEKTVQSGGIQYLVITDSAGEQHKISEKRQTLWEQFEKATKHEGFVVIYETYNNIEFVADAYTVASKLQDNNLRRAITEVVLSLGDQQTEERNRSTSLSYAKDMLCAGKIEPDALYKTAQDNYIFIKGQWKPKQE
jgi:hypothetical protein